MYRKMDFRFGVRTHCSESECERTSCNWRTRPMINWVSLHPKSEIRMYVEVSLYSSIPILVGGFVRVTNTSLVEIIRRTDTYC